MVLNIQSLWFQPVSGIWR